MKIEPISAAMNAPTRGSLPAHSTAAAVPTSTGAIAAGSVRGRAAISQILIFRLPPRRRSWSARVLGEVGRALLLERLAALTGLLAAVEEQVGVVGQLLDPGVAVLVGVKARLDKPQRKRREGKHLAAPGDRLPLETVERHDGVDQTHLERLLCVVL